MRSRYNHDGTVDPHAHHEHETQRLAEEALERRRQQEHPANTYNPGQLPGSFPAPVGTRGETRTPMQAAPESGAPKLPHEETLAQVLKVQPASPPGGGEHTLNWPVRQGGEATAATHSKGHRR